MSDKNSTNWENMHSTPDPWGVDSETYEKEKIQRQVAHIPLSANLLELGCGEGSTTAVISKYASAITAVDISDAALKRAAARKYGCGVHFVKDDIKSVDLSSSMYDCILLSEILYYLFEAEGEELHRWIEKLQQHVNPLGRIIAISVLTNPADTHEENKKRLMKRYAMHRAFARNNFQCLHEEVGSGVKSGDKYQQYLISVFGKSEDRIPLNPAWNNHIIPTWDDGPDYVFGCENTLLCIEDLLRQNVRKFHLFWTGAHLLSADARQSLGIQLYAQTGNSVSTLYKPGRWPEFLTASESIDPAVLRLCQEVKERLLSANIPLDAVIGFHGITHPSYDHPSHLQCQPANIIATEINFFQKMCRKAFKKPDFVVQYGRPPHGAGFPLQAGRSDHVSEFLEAASSLPQHFQWKLWRTSAQDWRKKWKPEELAAEAWQEALTQPSHSWDSSANPVLFHSRYYAETREEFIQFLEELNG